MHANEQFVISVGIDENRLVVNSGSIMGSLVHKASCVHTWSREGPHMYAAYPHASISDGFTARTRDL